MRVPVIPYLHDEPQLVVLAACGAQQVQAAEGGQVWVPAELAKDAILLLDLLQVVRHILQDLDGDALSCNKTYPAAAKCTLCLGRRGK